jgi:hypothetical protein
LADIKRRVPDLRSASLRTNGFSRSKLELIVQVIRTENALHIWSKKFDVADRDIRDVETEIAQSTQRSLLPATADSLVVAINTADPEAHDLYLRAAYLFYKADADSLRKSLELARRAVQLDPSFLRAHWLIVKAEQNLTAVGEQSSAEAERGWRQRENSAWQSTAAVLPPIPSISTAGL